MASDQPFDTITTSMDSERVLAAVRKLSKRGKLPGFETECPGLFRVAAFATPFDHHLVCHTATGDIGTELRFVLERLKRVPIIFALVLAFTVWPGVVLTDSLLVTWFGFYSRWSSDMWWLTYAWYIPLTAGPIPWMWHAWAKKSRASAQEHAREQIDKIKAAVEAE